MNKKIFRYTFLLLCTALFFSACEKDNGGSVGTAKGKIVMTVDVRHHQWGVPGIPVYLKYNASEFPGTNTSLYNRSAVTSQNGSVQFNELSLGNYYLYARGYDPAWGDTVCGQHLAVVDAASAGGNMVDVVLYVSE